MSKELSLESRFVDSNVFLYVLRTDPRFGRRAKELLRGQGLVTSTLVVSQVIAHLERRGALKAVSLFLSFLRDHPVEVLPTRLEDFEEAIKYAVENDLSLKMWDDLVIAVQMRRAGIEVVLSNDKDFDATSWVRRSF